MSAAPAHELGLCSIVALDRRLAEVAELAAACGLAGVEVTARAPHLAPDADLAAAREVGRSVCEVGVAVLCRGSYLGHDPDRSEATAKREVERAVALEAPCMQVWAEPGDGGRLLHFGSLEHGVPDQRALLEALLGADSPGPMSVEFLALDSARTLEERLAADVRWLRAQLAELAGRT